MGLFADFSSSQTPVSFQLPLSQIHQMTAFWRQVGLNYVNYSAICARAVRAALKEPFKTTSAGRACHLSRPANGRPARSSKSLSLGRLCPSERWMNVCAGSEGIEAV